MLAHVLGTVALVPQQPLPAHCFGYHRLKPQPYACVGPEKKPPEMIEMPLFDPLDDELPFPFPTPELPAGATPHTAPVLRFTFDRPMYRRLMTAAAESETKLFGHCVVLDADRRKADEGSTLSLIPRGLAREGAIGVAVRIVALDAPPPAVAVAEGGDGIEPPTSASVVGAFRFRVGRLVSSFPFVTARVETFADAPREGEEEKTAALEVEVESALGRLCRLSASIESAGDQAGAAMAAEVLAAPANLLRAHRRRVEKEEYETTTQRWEHFSLALCSIVELEHADAIAAVRTTSAADRFALLLSRLREALGEVNTLAALDEAAAWRGGGLGAATGDPSVGAALGGGASFTPIDIPVGVDAADADPDAAAGRPGAEAQLSQIPEGTRLEYWWNEEWGWTGATVVGPLRPKDGKMVHALRFDSDGSTEDCCLYFEDGGRRWRPLRPE